VKLDARPALHPAVERVLLDALADLGIGEDSSRYSAAWRRAALLEGVRREDDTDEPVERYAFSPRSTRGATRA
jgi:hypothetical protein